MSAIVNVIHEENKRLEDLIAVYDKKISQYPKGSLSEKKRNGKSYWYLVHREGSKVKFDYVGKVGADKVKQYADMIKDRRRYELMRRKAAENLKEVRVLLRVSG